jgi:hypothetical protein
VANRKKSHRGRSRKPRPDNPPVAGTGELHSSVQSRAGAPVGARTKAAPKRKPRAAERSNRGGSLIAPTYGERPQAPWHPLPLSELLILVGGVGAVIGLSRGVSHGGPPLFAGLAAVAIGTLEVTLREHRGGFRSHTILLSLLPVIVFHTLVVLVISAFTRLAPLLNLALLAVDLALFVVLFRLWRARFVDARREKAFGGR